MKQDRPLLKLIWLELVPTGQYNILGGRGQSVGIVRLLCMCVISFLLLKLAPDDIKVLNSLPVSSDIGKIARLKRFAGTSGKVIGGIDLHDKPSITSPHSILHTSCLQLSWTFGYRVSIPNKQCVFVLTEKLSDCKWLSETQPPALLLTRKAQKGLVVALTVISLVLAARGPWQQRFYL